MTLSPSLESLASATNAITEAMLDGIYDSTASTTSTGTDAPWGGRLNVKELAAQLDRFMAKQVRQPVSERVRGLNQPITESRLICNDHETVPRRTHRRARIRKKWDLYT